MRIFIILITFLVHSISFGQFPEKWLGHYGGMMYLSNHSLVQDSVEVTLDILEVKKDSIWTYSMQYFSNKFGDIEKNYHIIRRKDGKGFQMDELNGIKIDMAYMNDRFYEFFEVDNMIYSTSMRKIQDGILFEIFGASNDPSNETESVPDENNIVFNVFSMKPSFVQTAFLIPIE